MLVRDEIDKLFPADLPEPAHWEQQYPPRDLPGTAQVTRVCPSPTGFAHIGSIYVAMIDAAIARETRGAYLVRIEDTDQSREVEGAVAQFDRAFEYFGVVSDETDAHGGYATLTLCEGRTHQVKRMIRALGGEVVTLHRDRIGALELPADLALGAFRPASAAERALLVGMSDERAGLAPTTAPMPMDHALPDAQRDARP